MIDVRGRFGRALRAEETPVVVTAVLTAVPTAYAVQYALRAGPEFLFLLLLSIGVGIPRLYDHWGERYALGWAVAWTLGAAVVVAVEFTLLYLGVARLAGPFVGATVAFVLTDLGNIALGSTLTGGGIPGNR